MGDVSLEMIWKRLEELQSGQGTILQRLDSLDQKVGSMATTLVGVQRDIRNLQASVATLGVAVDDHTRRLDQMEKHLGLNAERH